MRYIMILLLVLLCSCGTKRTIEHRTAIERDSMITSINQEEILRLAQNLHVNEKRNIKISIIEYDRESLPDSSGEYKPKRKIEIQDMSIIESNKTIEIKDTTQIQKNNIFTHQKEEKEDIDTKSDGIGAFAIKKMYPLIIIFAIIISIILYIKIVR